MTTLTPALHCNDYCKIPFLNPPPYSVSRLIVRKAPDDNRFDLRPFLYPPFWKSWSFKKIDAELERIEKRRAKTKA